VPRGPAVVPAGMSVVEVGDINRALHVAWRTAKVISLTSRG
jgi:hypothetical protein